MLVVIIYTVLYLFPLPMPKSFILSSLAVSATVVLLVGCGAVAVPYSLQGFNSKNAYAAHDYAASPARTCEAARRALLSQAYTLDEVQAGKIAIAGHKVFQVDPTHQVELKFNAECDPRGKNADDGTTLFANGEADQYGLQRGASTSASLNVSPFGSLSMPLPSGVAQMAEVASETVTDPAWYQGFFDLTHEFLASGAIPENPMPSAAAPVSQAASAVTSVPLSAPPAPEQSPSITLPAASTPEQSTSAVLPAGSAPEQSASAALPTVSTPEQNPFGTLPAASVPKQSTSAALPAASAPQQSTSGALPAASAPKQN
jgi:hypothetical protein